MSTEDRFRRRTLGRAVAFAQLRRLGCYASHTTMDGHLYEFDQGRFWHADLHEEAQTREPVEDQLAAPLGPWYHHALCDCEFCAGAED
jgi:hypothetical protein